MEQPASTPRRGPKPNPNTRESLIQAGLQVLHATGYSGTGIKDITDTANVPKGSFYNYFESKEVFGREVVDTYFLRALPALQAMFTNEELPPLQRLKNYFSLRINTFNETGFIRGCLLGNMSLEVADQSICIREGLAEHFQTWSGLIEHCIDAAQQDGSISNPMPAATLARFLLNSWEGALLRMRVEKSDAALQEFVEVVFSTLLVGSNSRSNTPNKPRDKTEAKPE